MSFPKRPIDGTQASQAAWTLKEPLMPQLYRDAGLQPRAWRVKPERVG